MNVIHQPLMDGVNLIAVRTDQFKTNYLSVTMEVPLRAETATANALTCEVLYRGSRLHPDIEAISRATDELYGMALAPSIRQKGESQCISLTATFLDDHYALDGQPILEPAAKLMGEILLDPARENGVFRTDYVKSEGENLADLIRSQINEKRAWSILRVIQIMCQGEAYAVDKLGSAEEAQSMSPEKLWAQYQKLLKESKITFYYAGSAGIERVKQTIQNAFGPILTPRQCNIPWQIVSEAKKPLRTCTDHLDVAQGKLTLGFRTGGITITSPEYPALLVCNAIYGGTATSKLFMNVREKLSLCYFASSMVDKLKGLMVVSSGVEFSNFEIARQEILTQLENVRQGDFTDEELHVGRRSVINSLRTMQDSHGRMEDYWITQETAKQTETPDELMKLVEQVTKQQVQDVAARLSLDAVYYLAGKEEN